LAIDYDISDFQEGGDESPLYDVWTLVKGWTKMPDILSISVAQVSDHESINGSEFANGPKIWFLQQCKILQRSLILRVSFHRQTSMPCYLLSEIVPLEFRDLEV
jgi:hypothetical protein